MSLYDAPARPRRAARGGRESFREKQGCCRESRTEAGVDHRVRCHPRCGGAGQRPPLRGPVPAAGRRDRGRHGPRRGETHRDAARPRPDRDAAGGGQRPGREPQHPEPVQRARGRDPRGGPAAGRGSPRRDRADHPGLAQHAGRGARGLAASRPAGRRQRAADHQIRRLGDPHRPGLRQRLAHRHEVRELRPASGPRQRDRA